MGAGRQAQQGTARIRVKHGWKRFYQHGLPASTRIRPGVGSLNGWLRLAAAGTPLRLNPNTSGPINCRSH